MSYEDSITSLLAIQMTVLPTIHQSTSPMPTGVSPGYLSKSISWHAYNVSNDLSDVNKSDSFCIIAEIF